MTEFKVNRSDAQATHSVRIESGADLVAIDFGTGDKVEK